MAWLRKHFPELDRPVFGPHPAAVAEVIRLHWRHGKGQLTKRAHGSDVRAAVTAWDADGRGTRGGSVEELDPAAVLGLSVDTMRGED